jgi:Mce-associated membrane protein
MVVALATFVGWFGFRIHQSHQAQAQRSQLLQAARQGALNLTTIDWQHADADVKRILDGATGQFHDDFSARSGPFVDVVKRAKSVTVGTVTEAGLESQTADTAKALVAVTVTTSNAGTAEPQPRAWRLRVFVQKVGDQAKVSNVEFVS